MNFIMRIYRMVSDMGENIKYKIQNLKCKNKYHHSKPSLLYFSFYIEKLSAIVRSFPGNLDIMCVAFFHTRIGYPNKLCLL